MVGGGGGGLVDGLIGVDDGLGLVGRCGPGGGEEKRAAVVVVDGVIVVVEIGGVEVDAGAAFQ